jgi:hypothetical protein
VTLARRSLGALLALLAASAPLSAQSLGELARKEEARRGTAKKATRSFSDRDLPASVAISSITETLPSCYLSVSEGRCLTADEILARSSANVPNPETKKQEPMIRQESAAIVAELSRVQQEIDRFSATAADESLLAAQRALAADALAKRQPILEQVKQRWLKLERYVEQHRIPRQWIEPVPEFARTPR